MKGEFLSRQLSFLPEDMIEEAMNAEKKKTQPAVRWLRMAACLAVIAGLLVGIGLRNNGIVTGPGILAVTVYAEDTSSTTLSPDTVLPSHYYWSFANWAPGLPITLSVSDSSFLSENISFQVTVDGGVCFLGVNGGTSITPGPSVQMPVQFTVPNQTTIFWSQFYDASGNDDFTLHGETAYIDIIIFDGSEIIGYTILRLDRESPDSLGFVASMLDSVALLSGQEITEAYVRAQIEKAKIQD